MLVSVKLSGDIVVVVVVVLVVVVEVVGETVAALPVVP
jgi:hypothetical protein